MKLKALFVVLLAAGLAASIAVASPPPGKGKSGTTATTADGVSTTNAKAAKVLVCHKTAHENQYVLLSVGAKSAHARLKHGDVLAVGGACPGPVQGHTGTTTTTTTTP